MHLPLPLSPPLKLVKQTESRILLIEDDPEIATHLTRELGVAGFDSQYVRSGREADWLLERTEFDLIVLDIMLPGEDGFSICRRLRAASNVPIIILSALAEDLHRINGLSVGADDYVPKPLSSKVLIAHVCALLRRARGASVGESRQTAWYHFSGWRLDARAQQLYAPDGARVTMTSTEMELLLVFCRNPGRTLSREQLLGQTHSGLAGPEQRSIDVHISRVRQKIETDPRQPELIKTVRLGGYFFTAAVETRQ